MFLSFQGILCKAVVAARVASGSELLLLPTLVSKLGGLEFAQLTRKNRPPFLETSLIRKSVVPRRSWLGAC